MFPYSAMTAVDLLIPQDSSQETLCRIKRAPLSLRSLAATRLLHYGGQPGTRPGTIRQARTTEHYMTAIYSPLTHSNSSVACTQPSIHDVSEVVKEGGEGKRRACSGTMLASCVCCLYVICYHAACFILGTIYCIRRPADVRKRLKT